MSTRSEELFEEAKGLMAGGVNSPVRSFKAVGGYPRFVARAKGSRIWDVDGKEYIDYLGSWGPLILGHAAPEVVEAIREAAGRGTSYGAPTELEIRLARLLQESFPSMELIRLVNSGTEATMSALRLARGFTRRDLIVKFEGGYHGHADALLARAGSGPLTLGVPDSAGVPAPTAAQTLTLPFNDVGLLEDLMKARGEEVAALIVEPVMGNCGVIPPGPEFLPALRRLSTRWGALLIFDEVITGFRVAPGGAQALYGVQPDLTCLGKIIGGGLPVGAYGGRREIMEQVAPLGPVYQAGTLSGNPIAMAAGVATLEALKRKGGYDRLEELGAQLEGEWRRAAKEMGIPATVNRVGSMFCCFFTEGPVRDLSTAKRSDTRRYAQYFHAMLEEGVNLPPSQFETGFISTAHTQEDIARTGLAARSALRSLR